MKIKSLLLGSAAALMAVTGAQAADAVIVEAEPVEYVRVCDAYGAGYYYLPGTETCLRIGGYVRVHYTARQHHDGFTHVKSDLTEALDTQHHTWGYRARLNIDAQNETEYGTLRSQLRIQTDGGGSLYGISSVTEAFSSDGNPGDGNPVLDRALISLSGGSGAWRLGYSDDYWSTVGGYGYVGSDPYGGPYGFSQGMFFDYTYAADGFTATVGLSDNRRSGTAGQPDVYVGTTYSGSWGRAFGTYYYDSDQSAGAYKVGLQLSLADYIPGGAIKAMYLADDGDTNYVKGHVWSVSAKMNLADNWVFYSGYSDYDCTTASCAAGFATDTSFTDWEIGLRWGIAPGLSARFEYSKTNYDYQIDGVVGTGGNASRLSNGVFAVSVRRDF